MTGGDWELSTAGNGTQEKTDERYLIREMLEKQLQDQVLAFLSHHPKVAWVERMNVGAVKRGGRYIRFGRKGMCDITGQLKNGRRLEVEMKRPGEQPTEDQTMFIAMVNIAGGLAFVARSIDDAQEALARA